MAPRKNEDGEVIRRGRVVISRSAYEEARALLRNASQLAMQAELTRDQPRATQASAQQDSPRATVSKVLHFNFGDLEQANSKAHCQRRMINVVKKEPVSEWMSVRQCADEGNVHPNSVRRWVRQGRLPATRAKFGRLQIRRADFLKFMGRDQ